MSDLDSAGAALSKLNVHDKADGGIAISTYPKILKLDIGGRKFKVLRDILEAEYEPPTPALPM